MAILRSPVFLLCCLLFLLHQLAQKVLLWELPLLDNYIDSFLTMPILLTLLTAERRVLFRRGVHYCLRVMEVIMATLLVAFVAEIVFPILSDRFTADWLDVLAYALGSLLFLFTIRNYGVSSG